MASNEMSHIGPPSRSLLLTVLGEMVLPSGGVVWTQTLVDALDLFDIDARATRQAVNRMGQRGWLSGERLGRRTRWHLTQRAVAVLEPGADRIYSFGHSQIAWDESWLVLLVSMPDSQRRVRYRLRVGLGWAGFGSLAAGTWICPWQAREPEVVALLQELEITNARILHSTLGAVGDGREMAAQAWNLGAIADEYRAIDPYIDVEAVDDAGAARALLALVDQWRHMPLRDPALPSALLPPDWPGPSTAAAFSERRRGWSESARAWFAEREASYSPVPTLGRGAR